MNAPRPVANRRVSLEDHEDVNGKSQTIFFSPLPPGVELPDRRIITYSPHPMCPCADCASVFAALARGELRVPNGSLPW